MSRETWGKAMIVPIAVVGVIFLLTLLGTTFFTPTEPISDALALISNNKSLEMLWAIVAPSRALDSLLQACVLFAAALGVGTLFRLHGE